VSPFSVVLHPAASAARARNTIHKISDHLSLDARHVCQEHDDTVDIANSVEADEQRGHISCLGLRVGCDASGITNRFGHLLRMESRDHDDRGESCRVSSIQYGTDQSGRPIWERRFRYTDSRRLACSEDHTCEYEVRVVCLRIACYVSTSSSARFT
jgi:hypothetical protein